MKFQGRNVKGLEKRKLNGRSGVIQQKQKQLPNRRKKRRSRAGKVKPLVNLADHFITGRVLTCKPSQTEGYRRRLLSVNYGREGLNRGVANGTAGIHARIWQRGDRYDLLWVYGCAQVSLMGSAWSTN